jgi:hypothetical protein
MIDDLHDSHRRDNLGANIMRDNERRRGAFVHCEATRKNDGEWSIANPPAMAVYYGPNGETTWPIIKDDSPGTS